MFPRYMQLELTEGASSITGLDKPRLQLTHVRSLPGDISIQPSCILGLMGRKVQVPRFCKKLTALLSVVNLGAGDPKKRKN